MSTDDFSNSSLSFWHGGETPEYKETEFCLFSGIHLLSEHIFEIAVENHTLHFSLYLSYRKISTENVV